MNKRNRAHARGPQSTARPGVGAALLGAAMALPLTGPVHAEGAPDRGSISLKHLDYQDSQPGESRIHVAATSLLVVAPVAGEWSLSGTVTTDSISGASPAYQSSALTRMRDRRQALDVEVTRYQQSGTLSAGASVSSEADYLSRSLSVKASRASDDRNTTWTAGVGYASDAINPSTRIVVDETKKTSDLLLGVTQVLSVTDIVQLNVGRSWGRGYFSDPYKFADDRPRQRRHSTVMARWNHHLASSGGTLRSSYRYYSDSWNIRAHTLGLEYVQPLAAGWTVTPLLRLYSQSAADFYVSVDSSSYPFAPNSPGHYSEDQRLSAFGARTVGLKIAKQIDADWSVDAKFEQYGQRAAWRRFGDGSPGLAPFNARSVQLGVSVAF